MKPAPFDYVAPNTIDEACAILAEAGGGATILAGGQTLMPLLNLRMSQPFILVDINKISALNGISRVDGGTRIFDPHIRQLCDLFVCRGVEDGKAFISQLSGHRAGRWIEKDFRRIKPTQKSIADDH